VCVCVWKGFTECILGLHVHIPFLSLSPSFPRSVSPLPTAWRVFWSSRRPPGTGVPVGMGRLAPKNGRCWSLRLGWGWQFTSILTKFYTGSRTWTCVFGKTQQRARIAPCRLSPPRRAHRLWGTPDLLSSGQSVKLTSRPYQMLRLLKCVELHLSQHVCLVQYKQFLPY
jgi:hypothetical protein